MGFYAHLKGANLETSRKFSSQFIRDEQGDLLRDSQGILQQWMRHFQALLNNSSPMLDPRSYIVCRNSKPATPWVNHQRAEKLYLH